MKFLHLQTPVNPPRDLNKVPTVQDLQKEGWTVKCTHFRLETGVFGRMTPKVIRANYKHLLRVRRVLDGHYIAPKGGKTIVFLRFNDGKVEKTALGASICSPLDVFNKKTGRALAIERALNNIKYKNYGSD